MIIVKEENSFIYKHDKSRFLFSLKHCSVSFFVSIHKIDSQPAHNGYTTSHDVESTLMQKCLNVA